MGLLHDRWGRVVTSTAVTGVWFLAYVAFLIATGEPRMPWSDLVRGAGAVVFVAAVAAFGADLLLLRRMPGAVVLVVALVLGAGAGATLLVATGHPTHGEETNGLVLLSAGLGVVGLASSVVVVLLWSVRRGRTA